MSERRARLGQRHHLTRRTDRVHTVSADLAGLHSSDPVTVFLSARARVSEFERADLERALYEDKSLLRMLGMRRTLFVIPRDLAAAMDTACTKALVPRERKRLIGLVESQNVAHHGEAWVDRVRTTTLAALDELGEASATELSAVVPELKIKLTFGDGKKWSGSVGVSTRILFLLATEGRIVRARPRGTWISSQYRWTRTDRWLNGGLDSRDPDEARSSLIVRWLRAFGPGTLTDIKWWTGWTVRQTRATLARSGAVEVALADGVGFVLADDLEPVSNVEPWVALLPSLDSTVMGWKERDWYLGSHGPRLFDRHGNAGPTVWADGRIVGGWAQRSDGTVAMELLEDVGREAETLIEREVARLESWLGDSRVTPRFRTPLEKQLSSTQSRP